jgi:hypothetical protein
MRFGSVQALKTSSREAAKDARRDYSSSLLKDSLQPCCILSRSWAPIEPSIQAPEFSKILNKYISWKSVCVAMPGEEAANAIKLHQLDN